MKKTHLLFLIILSITATVAAQPSNGEPNKCYARCYLPDEWITRTTQIIIKEAATYIQITPAEFDTITEKVIDKAASTKILVIPAEFETITEQIIVKEASTRIEVVPPVYETVTDSVLAKAESKKLIAIPAEFEIVTDTTRFPRFSSVSWRYQKVKNCLSSNPDDCMVVCLVEVPVRYETITKSILKTPATTKEIIIPAIFQTVTKRIVKTPATTKIIEIPAEYQTITKKIIKTPAQTKVIDIPASYKDITKIIVKTPNQTQVIDIPAEYQTISKRLMVRKGRFTEWREIICPHSHNNTGIKSIQRKLKELGYYSGPIDGVLGSKLKTALLQFQEDNNLPKGRLDIKTLTKLGVQ